MTTQTRKEIMAHLVGLFVEARRAGLDDRQARRWVEAKCPGVPDLVLIEAAIDADSLETEAWWQSMERTIDGEVIARALAIPAKGAA